MGTIRLFLALSVALAHLALFLFKIDHPDYLLFGIGGGHAVMMFFVVSGFLMSFVLEQKYHGGHDIAEFYRARFLRIYPLWWAMILVVLVAIGITRWVDKPAIDHLTTLILFGADWRMAFTAYPETYDVLPGPLGIGWSLVPEVCFYLIAPFILRSNVLAVTLFVASSTLRAIVLSYFLYGPQWFNLAYIFFPTLLPFFLAGHFARKILVNFRSTDAWARCFCLQQSPA